MLASQLSDGTLRFICLATALLQPQRPRTSLFDEPELGLHPYALTLLGNLVQQSIAPHRLSAILPGHSVHPIGAAAQRVHAGGHRGCGPVWRAIDLSSSRDTAVE